MGKQVDSPTRGDGAATLFSVAAAKMKRARPEQAFHRNVVELLTLCLGGHAWFTTFPAGGGGAIRGRILRSIGLKAGVPDVLIVDGSQCFWLELKAPRGTVTEVQRECHKALGRAGSPVAVVRTPEELLAVLKNWGIALKHEWRAA